MVLAPVFGHAFTPFLKGKGGKALSTAAGSMLVFNIVTMLFRLGNLWLTIGSWGITGILWYKQLQVRVQDAQLFIGGSLKIQIVIIESFLK